MATLVRTVITCDKCTTELDSPTTRRLVVDGITLSYDLCADDDKAMADALGPWLEIGQTVNGVAPAKRTRRTRTQVSDALKAEPQPKRTRQPRVVVADSPVAQVEVAEIPAQAPEPVVEEPVAVDPAPAPKTPRKRSPKKKAAAGAAKS